MWSLKNNFFAAYLIDDVINIIIMFLEMVSVLRSRTHGLVPVERVEAVDVAAHVQVGEGRQGHRRVHLKL